MIKNPATEAKTLLELSLEQVFSAAGVSFFHRSYKGQSERRKRRKRKSEGYEVDFDWIDNALFYFSDNERLEVELHEETDVASIEPPTDPLIKRSSLLHKSFIVIYMLLPDRRVLPHVKEKNAIAIANELISTRSFDNERVYLDFNLSKPDGTLIQRVTAATFILDNQGNVTDYPVSRKRAHRLPKKVRKALPDEFEPFYAYRPGRMDYESFRKDLAALLIRQ
ncbi:hypothetical protein KY336_00875 [Candidatus Woesearchaeota archaeon]|nr:hypothetical protein [Candidatus Woesearchaeota archaeon]